MHQFFFILFHSIGFGCSIPWFIEGLKRDSDANIIASATIALFNVVLAIHWATQKD